MAALASARHGGASSTRPGDRIAARTTDGQPATIALSVPEAARCGGLIHLEIRAADLTFAATRLDWFAETAVGSLHLRGRGRLGAADADAEFRVDIIRDGGEAFPDDVAGARVIARIYEPGADPDIASPAVKVELLVPPAAALALPHAPDLGMAGPS